MARYNATGDSIASLAEFEAYATAVAWANGQVSDEIYLASLQKMVDLSNPGTRERVTNENKLGDAKYSIGRNQIALRVNGANTPAERTAALRELAAYDQVRLNGMQPDNEAYRSQVDRVSGVRVDIRQSQYSELVNKVNAGKATTAQLLAMARTFADQAGSDPDNDDWRDTIDTLKERVADEDVADAYQAYQHNRMKGSTLLAKIDARMGDMVAGSPAYKELARQREDLVERLGSDDRIKRAATINGQRADGKVTDSKFLAYLRTEVTNADPGTSERIEAENRLREFTFSIAEDKLRYDVTKGKRPVSSLIAFYKGARAGMAPNSERYRAITLAIDSLGRGGGSGGGSGGGGGGGGGAGKGLGYYTKQLTAESTLQDFLGSGSAPPGFADLFRVDLNNMASRRWWDNNLRSAVAAFQNGARAWVYYDKRGQGYQLAFSPSMMGQFDKMNYDLTRQGLAGAKSVKDAQFWTGKLITATKTLTSHGGQYAMDVYEKTFGDFQRAKESAKAGGRWAEYDNLVREQTELARTFLGGTLDPRLSTNPYLNAAARGRIGRDLDRIAPFHPDDGTDAANPDGDLIMQMIVDQQIVVDHDETGFAVRGTLDPHVGFLTQLPDGTVDLVRVDMTAPGGSVFDPQLDQDVPAYLSQTAPVVIRVGGQDIEVHQPIVDGGAALPVYVSKTGVASSHGRYTTTVGDAPLIPGLSTSVDQYLVNGAPATVSLRSFSTMEGTVKVKWVSLDGKSWVRYVPGEGPPPRVVIGSDYTYDPAKKKWQSGGKDVDPNAVLGSAHWWSSEDGKARGEAWGFGAPGRSYTVRESRDDGRLDTRADWTVPRAGPLEFDTRDSAEIRGYYFEDPTEQASRGRAGAQAAFESLPEGRAYALGPQAIYDRPPASAADAAARAGKRRTDIVAGWAAGLVPADARPRGPSLAIRIPGRGQLVNEDTRNIGYKAPPAATLRPAPTASLAPVTVRPLTPSGLAALKPVTLPKLKPSAPPRSIAAADAKAAAAKAAAAKATADAKAERDSKRGRTPPPPTTSMAGGYKGGAR